MAKFKLEELVNLLGNGVLNKEHS